MAQNVEKLQARPRFRVRVSWASVPWHFSSGLTWQKLEVKRFWQESSSLPAALQSGVCLTLSELSSSRSLNLSQCHSVYQHSFIPSLSVLHPAFAHSFVMYFFSSWHFDILIIALKSDIHNHFPLTPYCIFSAVVKPTFESGLHVAYTEMNCFCLHESLCMALSTSLTLT